MKATALMLTHVIDLKAGVGMTTWKVTRAGGGKKKCENFKSEILLQQVEFIFLIVN